MEKINEKLLDKEGIIDVVYEVKRVIDFIDSPSVKNYLKRGWRVIQTFRSGPGYSGETYLEKQYNLSEDERYMLYFIKLFIESRVSFSEYLSNMERVDYDKVSNSEISTLLKDTHSYIGTLYITKDHEIIELINNYRKLLENRYKHYLYDNR